MRLFLTLCVLAIFPACTAEESSAPVIEQEAAVVCCGGACDAPDGTCCSDGTCNGGHDELPLAPK